MSKVPKRKTMFAFLILQFTLGLIFLFNAIPFDIVLRLFGAILISLSPMWIVIFKITRMEKTKYIDKKDQEDTKKKMDEPA